MNYGMRKGKNGVLPLHLHADLLLRWKLIWWNKGKESSPFISYKELCTKLSELRGMPYRSVYMSLTGTAPNRLTCPDNPIQKSWAYTVHPETQKTGFVLRKSEEFRSGRFKENKPDYGTPEKEEARTHGFRTFLSLGIKNPRILTLGGEEGYCVKELLRSCPGAEIVNLEHSPSILKKFKEKFVGIPNVKSVLTKLDVFVQNDPLDFDFMNLDAMGYMCGKAAERFRTIDEKSRARVLTITMEAQRPLRNKGIYADLIREVCPATKDNQNPDQVRYALEGSLPSYRVVDDYDYKGHVRYMRMFVLVKRG